MPMQLLQIYEFLNKGFMKKAILYSFLFILTSNSRAQTIGVPDTLAYLNNIVANKTLYIGQPFSVLANSLQISIKYFNPDASVHHKKNCEDETSLAFYNSLNANDYHLSFPRLIIYWSPPFKNINLSIAIRDADSLQGWNAIAKAHYANSIIADIRVFE
jgi:hypothetical protein